MQARALLYKPLTKLERDAMSKFAAKMGVLRPMRAASNTENF